MPILNSNIIWMFLNCWLAVLPVIFCWLFLKIRAKFLKVILSILWLVFLPNCLYLFTDVIHIPRQWERVADSDKVLLLFQYAGLLLVGFVTYLLAVTPIERFLFKSKWKKEKKLNYALLITLNMVVGFGLVLGRIEKINSWELFIEPVKVIEAIFKVLSSTELLFLTVLFGAFANFFYFLFRKPFIKLAKRIDK